MYNPVIDLKKTINRLKLQDVCKRETSTSQLRHNLIFVNINRQILIVPVSLFTTVL